MQLKDLHMADDILFPNENKTNVLLSLYLYLVIKLPPLNAL